MVERSVVEQRWSGEGVGREADRVGERGSTEAGAVAEGRAFDDNVIGEQDSVEVGMSDVGTADIGVTHGVEQLIH